MLNILSIEFGGEYVEAGAQYIHGIEGNVAYKIAEGRGLLEDADLPGPEEIGGEFYYENGDAMDEKTTEKMWHYYKQVFQLAEQHDGRKSETVGEFFDRAISQIAGKSTIAEMLKDYIHRDLMVWKNRILMFNCNSFISQCINFLDCG